MALVKFSEHGVRDVDLVSGAELARLLGVTREAVSKASRNESGRLDVWEDSLGRPRFSPKVAAEQWLARKVTHRVTTPTRGQIAAGMDAEAAKAVAHLPLTNPTNVPAATLKTWDPAQGPLDLTQVDAEKRGLAMSRADKERYQAHLLRLKVGEKEGTLLDRGVFFQQAYTVAAALKDKLFGLPPQIGPQVVAFLEEVLVDGGHSPADARALLAKHAADHRVRELLRAGITAGLREISSKPLEELIRG